MYSERSRRFRRTKGYIVEQEIKTESLDSDLRPKVRFKVKFEIKSKVRIEEVLELRLGAGIEEQAIDKKKKKSHSILNSF